MTNSLVLEYNSYEYSGSGTSISDTSTNSRNGTIGGNPTYSNDVFTWTDSDYIRTPNLSSVIQHNSEAHTIELWINPTNNGVLAQYNGQNSHNTGYHFSALEIVSGKLEFSMWDDGMVSSGPTVNIPFNQWNHVVLTYDGSKIKGYLNGEYVTGSETTVNWDHPKEYSSSNSFVINFGAEDTTNQGDGTRFDGQFGVARVYNRALSLSEVIQNYNFPYGTLKIVESGGESINTTWRKKNNTIYTKANASINSSIIEGEGYLSTGSLTITADVIKIQDDISVSTEGNEVTFKAKKDIALNANVSTNNGNVHLWSDSDGNSSGRIGIYNGGITSNGGDIKLSGGTDGNSYAVGTNTAITSFANYRGIWFNNSTLNANGTSNGGNITIKGKGYTSEITTDYNIGVDFTVNSIIKTNHNGEILIDGVGGPHSTAGEHAAGINFFSQNQIFSASGTIELNGQAGGGSANNARLDAAINFDGGLSGVTYDAKIYSNSGDITLSGKKSSLSNSYGIMNGIDNIQTYIGTDGTNKTSGDITIISDNFDLQDNYHTIETSGALIIKPQSTSFSSIFNTSLIDIPSSINSLTIGTSSNTANITISDDIEVAGPISLYGGDITLSNSLSSTLSNANVLIKAKGDISLDANQEIHTKGGNIILWSNSDGGTSNGSIMLRYQSKLISGSSSVLGGHIWLGGGNGSETWNEITVGNGSAVGGKLVSPNKGGGEAGGDFNSSGIYLEYATIKSFGGDIFMKGKNGGSGNRGVTVYGSNLINSGDLTDISSGRIDLKAIADSGNGLITGYHDIRAAGTLTMSSAASGTAIDIQASSNTDDAFEVTGIVNLISNGTGNISIDGNTNDSDEFGITVGDYYAGQLNVLSASGNIDIKGHSKGLRITPTPTNTSGSLGSTSSLFLGKKSGTDVLSSTANISIKANEISTSTAANIETSGTLTWTSISESFSSSVNTNVINIPTTLTGLTIGTISNTANITISDDIEVAGPISMFGDDIVISGSISSTNSGSNILLKAKGYIYANINHDFSTNGGDLIFWSNSNNTSSGVENNEVDLRGNNNLTTSGGDIYLAGGLDNGNGRPAGYAYRGYDDTIKPADLGTNVTLDSEGGNIYIRGQGSGVGIGFTGSGVEIESNEGNVSLDGIGNASRGIWIGNNLDLNSNGGDIIMTGTSTSSYGIGFENSGISIDSGTGSITIVGQGNSNIGVYASDAFAINSDSNANTAISIKGSSNSSYGVYFGTGTSNKNILIQSTTTTEGKGDIIIEGSTVSGQIGVGLDFWGSGSLTQVLSGSGDIKIHAKGHESRTLYTSTGLFVGKSANSNSINGISPISSTTSGNISMLSEGGIYAGTGGGGQWTLSSGNSSNPGGDIIIASDTNNSEGGFMYFGSGGLTVNSYGGDITLGGGNTLGTGYATGSQYSSSYSGNGIRVDGDLNLNSSGNSTDTGGDINIRGKGYGSTWGAYNMNGFYKNGNATDINSGTGKINISALAPTTQTNATAVGLFISGGSNHLFTSANTSSDAIKIVGDSSDSNSSASEGIILRDASGRHEFVASGAGGGIIITAKGGDNDTETLQFNDPIYILANGGDIKIAAESENETAKFYGDSSGSLILGYTNASNTTYDLTSSTSQITINNTGSYDFAGLITSKSGNSSSSGGDFILSSNTNNSSSGNIRLHNGLDVETYGGDIFIGGGNIQGTGFALGQNVDNFSEGVRIDKTLKLDSGNGNISIKGKTSSRNVSSSGTGNSGFGIYSLTSNATIDSGTGTITIEGINQNATGNTTYSSGIVFALNNNKLITISSESTDNKAISLTGTAEGSNVGNYGMEVETTSPLKIIATGSGGGISLNTSQNSTSSSAKYDLVVRSTLDILAKDGPIELIGGANGVSEGYLYFSTPAYFGSKSGSDVTESSSDILIQYDDFSWGSNVPRLATSGTVTIKPNSSIFYDDNVETDWFSFNQNSQTMSGLTIGKDSNTSNVTVNSALTTNGPINIFGSVITVQRDLNSSSGNGNISLLAKDELTTASGRNININSGSGNITLLAESPVFDGGSSYTTNINTTGSFKLAPYEVVVDGFDNVSSQIEFQGSLSSGNFEGSGDIDGLTINSIENINGLTIGSASTNYSSNSGYHVLLKETADNRLSIGGPLNIYGNTITIESPISSGRDIKVVSNNVWINDELATNAITSTIELNAANQITQTASISTHILSITGSGTTNLNHSGNSVNKLSAGTATITTGTLSFTNSKALEIGANSQGIKSNGTISVGTLSGNLTLTENISTTNTSDNAIRLLADADTSAPNEGNGNIIISGTPTLTTGSGGRASLFSGKPTSSTGLVNLVGNNNIRIGVDSSTTTFEPSLSSGVYALFRDGPKINLSETSLSIAHTPSTNSLPKSFVLSATGLSQAVSLSAPAGFEISLNEHTGYTSTLNVSQTSGSITDTFVYIRITSIVSGYPTGTLSATSQGAVSESLSLTATAKAALDFDGVNDYVEIPYDNDFNITGDLTMATWFYLPTDYSGGSVILGRFDGTSSTNVAYSIRISGAGNLYSQLGNGTVHANSSLIPIENLKGKWSHVAVSFNATNNKINIYLNGIHKGETIGSGSLKSMSSSSAKLSIGTYKGGSYNGQYFKGKIDELSLWNKVLSHNEIEQQLYKSLSGTENNLVAYYNFNNGVPLSSNSDNDTLYDSVGDNDGDLGNRFDLSNASASNSTWVENPFPESEIPNGYSSMPIALWKAIGTNETRESHGLTLTAPSTLSAENYVNLAANTNTGTTTSDVSSTENIRSNRIWYVNETGSVSARVKIGVASATGQTVSSFVSPTFTLIRRDGTSGNFSRVTSGTRSGDIVTFTEVDLEDGYYSLGVVQNVLITPTASQSKTLGADDPVLEYTTSPNVSLTGTLSRTAGEDIGTYTITLGTISSSLYSITLAAEDFEIVVTDPNINGWDNLSLSYGDTSGVPSYTTSATTTPSFTSSNTSVAAIHASTGTITATGVGTTTLWIYFPAGGQFVSGTKSLTVTVLARTITVTAAAKTKVFGESDPELTFTATPAVGAPVVAGSSATVTFTGTLTRTAGENAGSYSITLGTLSNTNYNIDYVGANFSITKAPTDIDDGDSDPTTETLSDTTITFGDADLLLTPSSSNTADYTFTSSDSSVASITTTSSNTASIRNMGVGSAVISISQAADANYQAKTVSYTLNVNPLSVSVTAAAKSKNYGDTDPSLTYVSSPAVSTPLSNSSTITFTGTLSRTTGENAGTYSITLGTLTNTNYSIDYVGTNLTIAKITPTITLNDLSVVYGDADLNLAHSATDSYTIVSPTDNSGTAKWITNGHYNSPPLTFGGNWYQPWLDAPISWAAKEASGINYYIQLDLGEEQLVSGIITQGKGSGSNHQWIKRAKIEYSSDGVNFTTAFSDTPLNTDGNSKVHTDFSTPTRMRHIRLWSTGVNQNHASVRMGAKVLNTYNSGTYTSANTSVGTISDTLFSNIGVGTTVISYTQDSSMNYLSATKTFTLTVNPLAVTVSPTSTISKIYGATDPALTFTYSPTATVNSKTITFTGELLRDVGENVGTYSITLGTLTNTNYNISLVEENFEITAKTITATLTGSVNKTYNGTVSATLHTSNFELNGFVSGESATITQTFGAYDSKNVGTNKEVSVSLSNAYAPASGTLLSNYILAATATGTVGNITAKTLTVTNITALDKVYDGSTNSNINSSTIVYNGLELGDDVSINSTSAVFDNKNVGVNKTVSLTNTYTGADLSNYTLVDQASATASITAKTVSASLIGSVTKVYNGTLSATLNPSNFQLNGVISGESIGVSATQGTYDTKEIGSSKMVTVSLTDYYLPDSGTLLSNYALADTATGTVGTITAQTLTVTGIVVLDKVFDGTASSTVMTNTIAYEGLAAGDNVYIDTSSGVFADANVGQGKTVNLTNTYAGTDLTNYTVINQATTTASITTKPITIIPTASQSKTYGEANTPLTYTISPSTLPNGTAITLGGTLSRTLGENVGTYSITLGTVSNTNYDITLSPETFEITKKTVTVSGITASDKVYDANTNASVDLSGITFTGKETGDTITATATGTFDTKDIGTAKTVSLSATYSSSALANYTIVDQSSTTASITAKTVSVTGSTGLNKTYDGNTNLPLGELGYGALSGVIGSEDVTLTGVGVYDAASVGSRTIAIGTVTLTGADKDNYNLNWTNGSGTISKKTLTVTANNDAKFVGESDTSGFNGVSYSGFEGADSVSDINVSGLSITRSNSSQNDAGNYPGTLVPSGVVATNYDFNYVAGDYTIIPADKLLLRVANQTTTYGTAASYSITSAQYYKTGTGLVSLTVPTPVSGVYPINDGASTINIRVQPASPVNSTAGKLSVGSYGLSGTVVSGSSGNFSNNIEVIGSHSVAKKSLTATASGVSKVYDATTSMSGVSLGLTGLESYDLVTVNGTGAFSSPSAGTGLSYTIAGLSLAGADADNYYLS
ncbi:MAG: YDG domain-containing protein, partial [Flavobacteriaceae bacterium]|nr:YDG domain-containing protein [Flavobacteriaceae bacterium]MCI5087675.1 YDG domain-containing protein [Flavobacteriaceae bacterium]